MGPRQNPRGGIEGGIGRMRRRGREVDFSCAHRRSMSYRRTLSCYHRGSSALGRRERERLGDRAPAPWGW